MNTLKKFLAFTLCLALVVACFTGCHQKGEIAVKIGEIEFTSGYYACALVFADAEGRNRVDEALGETGLTSQIEYWKQTIDGVDYSTWVKNTALADLKNIAAVKTLCSKANVTLDDATKSNCDSYIETLWTMYQYSSLMEENGVSKDTFIQYIYDSELQGVYFNYLYGKDGDKEIPADDLKKELTDNYMLVNMLEVSFKDLKDDQKADKKDQLTSYETALKDGSKTFEEIYIEFKNEKAEEHEHKKEEGKPLDSHATVLESESEHFETVKKMAVGDVKIVTLEEDAGLVLLVKKDILADPYYLDSKDGTLRQNISGEAFDKDIAKLGAELNCVVTESSVKQFKVKDIYYPEATY